MRMCNDLNTIALFFGALLTVKKVADMDRFYEFRLFLLIAFLCVLAFFFFFGFLFANLYGSTCMPEMGGIY